MSRYLLTDYDIKYSEMVEVRALKLGHSLGLWTKEYGYPQAQCYACHTIVCIPPEKVYKNQKNWVVKAMSGMSECVYPQVVRSAEMPLHQFKIMDCPCLRCRTQLQVMPGDRIGLRAIVVCRTCSQFVVVPTVIVKGRFWVDVNQVMQRFEIGTRFDLLRKLAD